MDTKLEDLKLRPSLLRELNQTRYEVVGDMQHLPELLRIPWMSGHGWRKIVKALRGDSHSPNRESVDDVASSCWTVGCGSVPWGAGTEKDAATRSASQEGEMNEPTRSLRAEIVALPATRSKPAAAQMVP